MIVARLIDLKINASELHDLTDYPMWACQVILAGEAILPAASLLLLTELVIMYPVLQQLKGQGWAEFKALNPVQAIRNEYNPDFFLPPGATLKETLEYMSHPTIKRMAATLGMSEADTTQLLRGEMVIDEGMAEKLHSITGVAVSFWLNSERNFREKEATYRTFIQENPDWDVLYEGAK